MALFKVKNFLRGVIASVNRIKRPTVLTNHVKVSPCTNRGNRMASTNKRSTTGGGDGENVPQGGLWADGGYSVEMANDRPAMAKCHEDIMVLCRRDKLRMLELWRGVVAAVGRWVWR